MSLAEQSRTKALMFNGRSGPKSKRLVRVFEKSFSQRFDDVVGEEPLEIHISQGGCVSLFSVTMRTPGNDFELVAGLLYAEGFITDREDIAELRYSCNGPDGQDYNVIVAHLRTVRREVESLERTMIASSACGVCGKSSLGDRFTKREGVVAEYSIDASYLLSLVDAMRSEQRYFDATGGVHAAGMFDLEGRRLTVKEDVGRHNAVDKAVGYLLLNGELSKVSVMVVSGRAGFEILQKALVARVGVVASVSAPTSLAIDLATEKGITLVGFLREKSFNIYSHPTRISSQRSLVS